VSLLQETETSISEHEEAFVNAFIVREKRQRYRDFLAGPRRRKVLSRLNHVLDLDERFSTRLHDTHPASALLKTLRDRGAGRECYLIAENSDLDQRIMTLEDAIEEVSVEDSGVVVSCTPGRLALYKAEDHRLHFLLERPASAP
jgi:hypothetical protein